MKGAAVAVFVLIIAGMAGAAFFLIENNHQGSPVDGDTSTLPCSSPGVTCGGVNITSGSLTVNGSYSFLQVTVAETGNAYIGSATVYVNGTVIGVPPASEYEPPGNVPLDIQHGQQAVLVLTIPNSTIPVQAGMTYSVVVYAWEGSPGQRASAGGPNFINVKAD